MNSLTANFPQADDDLLAAARTGDADALGQLVSRYTDFVYAAAVRRTGDRHLAEDITQAVFLVLQRRPDAVRGPVLAAWLHRTARYAAGNALRSAARRRRHERAAARTEADMARAISNESSRPALSLLDDAIESLGMKDRTAVVERYLRDRAVADVARSLGSTPEAAQKRLERAVAKLRVYLTGRGAAVSVVGMTALLVAAAPSPASAAPPGFAATMAAAVADPALTTTGANAVANGVLTVLTRAKITVAVGVAVSLLAAGGVIAVGIALADHPSTATTQSAPVAGADGGTLAAQPGYQAALRDGSSAELVAILDEQTGQWFEPDGTPTTRPAHAWDFGKPITSNAYQFLIAAQPKHNAIVYGNGFANDFFQNTQIENGITYISTHARPDRGTGAFVPSINFSSPLGPPLSISVDNAGQWLQTASAKFTAAEGDFELRNPRDEDGHAVFDLLAPPIRMTRSTRLDAVGGQEENVHSEPAPAGQMGECFVADGPLSRYRSFTLTLTRQDGAITYNNVAQRVNEGTAVKVVVRDEPAR